MSVSGVLKATHYAGEDFIIDDLGNNQYRITQKVYRDCRGIPLNTSQFTTLTNLTTNTSSSFNQPQTSQVDITPLCPGQTSPCPGGTNNFIFGLEEHIFSSIVTLLPLQNYRVSVSNSARNAAITTGPDNEIMYIYANFRTGVPNGNSSPRFLNRPVGNFCVNQPSVLSPNGFDPDGDAIVYSLQSCMQSATQASGYILPFSATNPLSSSTPISLNPNTGALSFTPSVAGQVAIICLRADEYRNGVLIGSVVRDMQINIVNCNNAPPVVAPLPNVVVNVGQTYCVNVSATDANNDNITLTAVSGIIPPGTFVQNTNNPGSATGTFCFTPTLAHVGNTYTVSINAVDNSCPSPASGVGSFNITVPVPCNMTATATGTDAACGVNNGTATVTVTNGTAPFSFSWTGPSGFTSFNQSISGLAPGTYSVLVVDGNSCVANASVVVGATGSSIVATTATTTATCNQNNGSVTITASGGTAPYLYGVDGGPLGASSTFTGLGVGAHTFAGQDANGCAFSGSFSIVEARDVTPPTIACQGNVGAGTDPGACCATVNFAAATATDDCGNATVTQTGGSASGTCFGLGTHTITFTATDDNNNTAACSFTINVSDNEAPTINCPADVTVNCVADLPSGGIGNITTSDNCGGVAVTFSETSTGTGCAGSAMVVTRTYTAEDQNHNVSSCVQTLTAEATPVVVTCSNTVYVIPAWQDSACATISATASGGCGPYRYLWCNGSQASSQSVCPTSSASYCVTVTDAQGCSAVCCVSVCVVDITCSGGTNNGQNGTGQGGNGTNNSLNAMQHIAICHFPPGNHANGMTKCLPIPAANQHFQIGHGGDYLGACGTLPSRQCNVSRNCDSNKGDVPSPAQAGGESVNMNVFPSPTSGVVTVEVGCNNCGDADSYALKVTDIYGKVVLQTEVNLASGAGKTKLDLSRFAAGVYMVTIDNGNQRLVERIVKQ